MCVLPLQVASLLCGQGLPALPVPLLLLIIVKYLTFNIILAVFNNILLVATQVPGYWHLKILMKDVKKLLILPQANMTKNPSIRVLHIQYLAQSEYKRIEANIYLFEANITVLLICLPRMIATKRIRVNLHAKRTEKKEEYSLEMNIWYKINFSIFNLNLKVRIKK